jgi:hypothetical protein
MRKNWTGLLILALAAALQAKQVRILEMRSDGRHVLADDGISVRKALNVRIKVAGIVWKRKALFEGWILDGKTRKVVWSTDDAGGSSDSRLEEEVGLPQGEYEVYYALLPEVAVKRGQINSKRFWDDTFDDDRKPEKDSKAWGMEIWADEKDRESVSVTSIPETEKALVRLAPLGNHESEKEHFTLGKDTRVRIYAVGEGVDREMADYGWIVRDDTGDEVWTMNYPGTKAAGGAEKNRMCDEIITLPRGEYTVSFTTDDSHSYAAWNALPPYDPRHWGLTLYPANGLEENQFLVKPKETGSKRDFIVDLTRIGDDRLENAGFTLTRPLSVKIVCQGEMGHDRSLVDYGWILDAKTREVVWDMGRSDMKHAGGAEKNRIASSVMTLEPGSYEVYYITDDSHAYGDWNAGPPRDPDAWGITVRAAGEADPGIVRPYREEDDRDLLVKIVRVRDDEKIRRTFELAEDSRVRVYAVGEGRDGEMFDYGWISDEDGHKVWRMRYEDTDPAGGAGKNRMVNETVKLKAGAYTVYFKTDDSHAFDDWNDDPPRDPASWGITVRRVR